MADFSHTYEKFILPFEGGYVNNPNDRGGETYAGITRKYNPAWEGWTYIDFVKRTQGEIKRNTKFPDIDYMVRDYYETLWRANRIGEIKTQSIANLLFDYIVHSGAKTAIKSVQKIVGAHVDGIIGDETIRKINAANTDKLYNSLLVERGKLIESIVESDETQKVFEKGWTARLAAFATEYVSKPTWPISILIIVVLFLIFI